MDQEVTFTMILSTYRKGVFQALPHFDYVHVLFLVMQIVGRKLSTHILNCTLTLSYDCIMMMLVFPSRYGMNSQQRRTCGVEVTVGKM